MSRALPSQLAWWHSAVLLQVPGDEGHVTLAAASAAAVYEGATPRRDTPCNSGDHDGINEVFRDTAHIAEVHLSAAFLRTQRHGKVALSCHGGVTTGS